MTPIGRRALLAGTAILLVQAVSAQATTIKGGMPWHPDEADPPTAAKPGPWQFFTPEEGAAVEALVDRLIPPDPDTPGGKDAGCAVFIDRQLAGPYGASRGFYMRPPFQDGTAAAGRAIPAHPRRALPHGAGRARHAIAAPPSPASPSPSCPATARTR